MTWKKVKLREVISHRKGFIEIDDETEYKLVTVKLHRKGVFLRENLQGFQIRTKKQQVCKAGDFIVAEMDAKVGGYGFIPVHLDGAIVSSHYFLFDVNEDRIRPQYLEVVSQLKILQDQIKAVGSTNYAAIRPYNVLDWEIPFPPIEKQIEIENLYLVAKEKVNLLNLEFADQLTLLENLKQAILQEAVQGKLVKQDPKDEPATELLKRIKAEKAKSGKKEKPLPPIKPEEIPFEIPENWVWCRLGEIIEMIYGKSLTKAQCIESEKYPVYGSNGVVGFYNEYLTNKRTIIVGRKGSAGALNVCHSPSWTTDVAYYIEESEFLDFDFTYYLLKSIKLEELGKGIKPGVNRNEAYNIPIPLPPLSEQKRIVSEIEKQLAKTKQLKDHIIQSQQATEQLLKALLHQAFEVEEMEAVNS